VTSSAAVTSTTPGGSSLTFIPDADARVEEQQEKATFGTEGSLRVDGEDQAHGESYLRFTLRGVSEEVEKAVLRVYAMSSTDDGPMLYTTKNEWAESTIAWANRPPRDSTMIGEGGKIQSTSWVEYDVTTIVKGEGVYSFVLTSNSDDGISFVSREGDYPPELVVTLAN
jgi:hypothetical protein